MVPVAGFLIWVESTAKLLATVARQAAKTAAEVTRRPTRLTDGSVRVRAAGHIVVIFGSKNDNFAIRFHEPLCGFGAMFFAQLLPLRPGWHWFLIETR